MVLGGSSAFHFRMLLLSMALYKVLDVTEIRSNIYNILNRLLSCLDFGSFQKAVSCNLLAYMSVCVYTFEYAYDFEHYKLKTIKSLGSHETDNLFGRCSYLWLSYWCDFFSSSVSEIRQVDRHPQNICFCHLPCLVPTQKVHCGQRHVPSWILQACCTSVFGTWSLEGIISLPPRPVLSFTCSL